MVSREVFEKYYEIMVEYNTGISREDHLDIMKNYKEIFDRYERNVVVIDDKEYLIEAEYASEERCLMDGYELYKDDIYIYPGTCSAAIVCGY